jgi:uncharacterized membrane protein YciS (DUF1049 family)
MSSAFQPFSNTNSANIANTANTANTTTETFLVKAKQYVTKNLRKALIIVILIICISALIYYKDRLSFVSADSSIIKKSNNQVHDGTNFDKDWNLKEFEASVALLNKKLM